MVIIEIKIIMGALFGVMYFLFMFSAIISDTSEEQNFALLAGLICGVLSNILLFI